MQYEISFNIKIDQLTDTTKLKDELIEDISSIDSSQISSHNDKISKSDWNLDSSIQRKYIDRFRPYLIEYLSNLKPNNYVRGIKIHNIWFQQYDRYDRHDWHNHPECQFSGVYFLKLQDKIDSTEFLHPTTNKVFQLEIKEGDIITFPSFVYHRSPPVKSETKTVISFNFSWI